jgi:hypothetical protein
MFGLARTSFQPKKGLSGHVLIHFVQKLTG